MLVDWPLDVNLISLAFLVTNWAAFSEATIIDRGRLAVVDGINYYVGGASVSRITLLSSLNLTGSWSGADIIPMTVIQSKASRFSDDEMEASVANFTRGDDVFQLGFLEAIFVNYVGKGQGHIDSNVNWTANGSNSGIIMASSRYHPQGTITRASLTSNISEGPYFLSIHTGALYQAFRLYPDHQLAFTEAALSDGSDGFMPLPAVTEGAMTKSVAVPSRLYYTPTPDKPLAGLRLGVKDIFHLKGLRTSGGNRAFYGLYPPRNETGSAVQRLIDAGAVVVGKMGTVQFANGDNPTADWVDFHCPFNPRGDGYQAPGGSSSGPAAGIAAYDWLDIAVGSDTGGSMRNPAGLTGLYATRPSTGAVGLDGILPLSGPLDSVGVFARDARTWATVLHTWYRGVNWTGQYRAYPKRLLYSYSSFPDADTEAGALLEELVVKLERFLGTKREYVDTPSLWEQSHPAGAPSNVTDLLNTTYAILTSVYQYNHLALPFFTDYANQHDGRQPFINPGPLVRWAWGQENGGDAAYTTALTNKTIFKDWWESEGYGVTNEESCSQGIYIYPYSTGKTQYRNEYTGSPTEPPMGFKDGRIGSMAGVPDFVVPVGEVPYNSTVSRRTEYMPVTMSFVAARGCDLMLVDLVRDLEDAGVLRPVETGERMYR
ncbi:amidase signature domain-containing protein [Aspergillus varians]